MTKGTVEWHLVYMLVANYSTYC